MYLFVSGFYSLRKIGHQLWVCCGNNGIVKLEPDELQRPKQDPVIACDKMGAIQDVVETGKDNVVIATSTGLYLYDVLGMRSALIC